MSDQNKTDSTLPPKKWWGWIIGVGAVVLGFLVLLLKVLFTGNSAVQKNFVSTNNPDKVETPNGEIVTLPTTQNEGQLTDKKTAAVTTIPETQVQTQEIKTQEVKNEIVENPAPDAPAPGQSAGDLLFGPRSKQ